MKITYEELWTAAWPNVVRLAHSLGVVAPLRAGGPRRERVIQALLRRCNGGAS